MKKILILISLLLTSSSFAYSGNLDFFTAKVKTVKPQNTVEIKYESKNACENVGKILRKRLMEAGKVILKDLGCVPGYNPRDPAKGSIVILKH